MKFVEKLDDLEGTLAIPIEGLVDVGYQTFRVLHFIGAVPHFVLKRVLVVSGLSIKPLGLKRSYPCYGAEQVP